MNTALLIVAAVIAVIGLVLIYFWRKTGLELTLMKATPMSRAADVAAMAPDSVVAVTGPLRCDAPLTGEFSKQPCVYYRAMIEREYEREVRDAKGETRRERQRETMQTNERFAPCMLEDASGKIALDFTGAKVEGVEVVKRFEPTAANLGSVVGGLLGGSREIGFYYTETIIAPNTPVYVLGAVHAGGMVGVSHGKKTPFIITHKSEQQREKDLGKTRMWQMAGAVACFVVAAVFLYFAAKVGSGDGHKTTQATPPVTVSRG